MANMLNYKQNSFVSICGDDVIYDFDDIVKYVFTAYFSSVQLALLFRAMTELYDGMPETKLNDIDDELLEEKKKQLYIEKIKNNVDIADTLINQIASLMKLTIECRRHLGGKSSEYCINYVEELLETNIRVCFTECFAHYCNLFQEGQMVEYDEEFKYLRRPQTGFHIDHNILVPCITEFFLTSFFDSLHKEYIATSLPGFIRYVICNHLSLLFAKFHYTIEDLPVIENQIRHCAHADEAIKIGCRYSQVSAEAVRTVEEFYNRMLLTKNDKDAFFRTEVYRELSCIYMDKYHQKRYKLEEVEAELKTQHSPIPTYESIIEVLNALGKNMERMPSLYKNKDEEGLRDAFLVFLNSIFKCSTATGETFNHTGKTDILLRHASEGANLFIAECKIWNGADLFLKSLDQLLSYLTWRDTHAALILFVERQNFTRVLQSIGKNIGNHNCYSCSTGNHGESSTSHIFHLPQDKERKVKVEVMAFHLDMR